MFKCFSFGKVQLLRIYTVNSYHKSSAFRLRDLLFPSKCSIKFICTSYLGTYVIEMVG